MFVGASQFDITPQPGIELCGFARRVQPSLAVLDRLFVRGLYLEDGPQRLLWLQNDLVGVERSLVIEFRQWVQETLGLPAGQVMVGATHTHSGPATVPLTACGRMDAEYIRWLLERWKEAAREAMARPEPCRLVTAEGRLPLGVDRTELAPLGADPTVGAVAWRRPDGTFNAVLLNYAMHPVGLDGRMISADYPGRASEALSAMLPGTPRTLFSLGACGNIDPPAVGVPYEQVCQWGQWLAEAVAGKLQAAEAKPPAAGRAQLQLLPALVRMPLDCWSKTEIDDYADRCLADTSRHGFGGNYGIAIEHWRGSMKRRVDEGAPDYQEVELFGVLLGNVILLGINAEIFSQFTSILRARGGQRVYAVSCANGLAGYIPVAEAYEAGGYEVSQAMLFYDSFRPRRGALEQLAEQAAQFMDRLG